MNRDELVWLPNPRQIEFLPGEYRVETGKRIVLTGTSAAELLFSAQRLQMALQEKAGANWTVAASAAGEPGEIGAVLQVHEDENENENGEEGYRLGVGEDGIKIEAQGARGVFYGVCSVIQLLEQSGQQLPWLQMLDRPDFANRGVMLDISRDKVPTMETLFALIDLLAGWKVNQLQLYTEHTFSYRNHPDVWREASPITEQEALELDAYCRERQIELVPNQNSFGHMRRWLTHPRYRDLAECPEGCDTAWGHFDQPYSLNPADPRSLELVCSLYDELLPNFRSRQVNVGCDETVDLGRGRSEAQVGKVGVGRVYLDFVKLIHREVEARGHTMQFWGDIIIKHPELVRELPADSVALEWGYEADHPFAEECAQFARAGIPFYVCPGTSSWNSILGRTENAIGNIRNAAENGLATRAVGILNTDWGDNGHWQYLPVSYLGFAYGAGMSWCSERNREMDLPVALDRFAFRDEAGVMGALAFNLGNVYRVLGAQHVNSTVLGRALFRTLPQLRGTRGLTQAGLEAAIHSIEKAAGSLAQAKGRCGDARLVEREFKNAALLSMHAARRCLLALENDMSRAQELKRELRAELPILREEHAALWAARNRPGGFKDSIEPVVRAGNAYT